MTTADYPGESDAKRLARGIFYAEMIASWQRQPPQGTRALALLGDGGELEVARVLALYGVTTVFAEINARTYGDCVERLGSSATLAVDDTGGDPSSPPPGAVAVIARASWREACAAVPDRSVALAHLDWMGPVRSARDDLLALERKLAPDAVVCLTASYGRERDLPTFGPALRQARAERRGGWQRVPASPVTGRILDAWVLLSRLLNRRGHPVFCAKYVGHRMPMMMIAACRKSRRWPFHRSSMTQPLRCLSGDLRAELLAQAAYNDNDVALLFNVPTATLVAWKAHQTRGTYSAAASPELRHG